MKLIVVHYHLRPGGIRRIIEQATPHLVKHSGLAFTSVTLAVGQRADEPWHQNFNRLLEGTPVTEFIEPSFNYFLELRGSPGTLARRLRAACKRLLGNLRDNDAIVWAHNLGIARNLLLTRELSNACARRGLRLIAHHHDWWFDNRWLRWPEIQRCGFRTLNAAAESIFPVNASIQHVVINRADAVILRRHLGARSGWLPNLTEHGGLPSATAVKRARAWLAKKIGSPEAPVWIVPCRLLRRKNLAEALLLKRWLRPEATLVTTGAASSADEQAYFAGLQKAATANHWRLRLGILGGRETDQPSVVELLAASEAVLLTSIQEGFGLPYLEAAAARRPLIARRIPNIAPDLEAFGFKLPQCYDEILIAPGLFDWKAERARQLKLFREWKRGLPAAARKLAGRPELLAVTKPIAVPFSRLTLTAQLEVLSQPPEASRAQCEPLNPWLKVWRRRASRAALQTTRWPKRADEWLSGAAYGKQFGAIARKRFRKVTAAGEAATLQTDFIRERLDADHLFPLLWARES